MILLLVIISSIYSATLQEAYDDAPSMYGYDKYIVLDTDSVYYGGLGLYEGNIFIDGRGATINLESGNGIWIYADENYPCSLEIQYCSIIYGGYYGSAGGRRCVDPYKDIFTSIVNISRILWSS